MKIANLEILENLGVDDFYYLFNYLKANEDSDEWIIKLSDLEKFTGYNINKIIEVLENFKYYSSHDYKKDELIYMFDYEILNNGWIYLEICDESIFGQPHSEYEGDDFEFKKLYEEIEWK